MSRRGSSRAFVWSAGAGVAWGVVRVQGGVALGACLFAVRGGAGTGRSSGRGRGPAGALLRPAPWSGTCASSAPPRSCAPARRRRRESAWRPRRARRARRAPPAAVLRYLFEVERVRQRLRERHARVERCLRDRPRDNDLREEHRQHDLLAAEDRRADAVERLEEQQRQRGPPEREARARRSREHERPHDDERAAEAHRHAHVEPAPMRAAHGGHAAAVRAERCREPARDEQERVEPVESKAAARASRPTRARATLRGSLCGCEDKLIQEMVAARPALESVCA